jgi:hypothetical protein
MAIAVDIKVIAVCIGKAMVLIAGGFGCLLLSYLAAFLLVELELKHLISDLSFLVLWGFLLLPVLWIFWRVSWGFRIFMAVSTIVIVLGLMPHALCACM